VKQCPVCNKDMADNRIVCDECQSKIDTNEKPRRESVLYAWGRGLMVFLACMFFFRGMYALLDAEGYQSAGKAIGLHPLSQTAHYMNASLLLLTGILFAVSWIGGYLEKIWHRALCLATLVMFIVGQLVVQFQGVASAEDGARSAALVLFWVTLPVIQYIAFSMGKPHKPINEK